MIFNLKLKNYFGSNQDDPEKQISKREEEKKNLASSPRVHRKKEEKAGRKMRDISWGC